MNITILKTKILVCVLCDIVHEKVKGELNFTNP